MTAVASCEADALKCWPHSTTMAVPGPGPSLPWWPYWMSGMPEPRPCGMTRCTGGRPMAMATAPLRSKAGYTQKGTTSWLVEWMSRMWSAASTTPRMARARCSSGLSSTPSSHSADQMRFMLCTSCRLSKGFSMSKLSYAATLAKLTVSVPIFGRTPVSSRWVAATMPQISLPCVSALMSTCGPGRPDSKRWTYSTPVLPAL